MDVFIDEIEQIFDDNNVYETFLEGDTNEIYGEE